MKILKSGMIIFKNRNLVWSSPFFSISFMRNKMFENISFAFYLTFFLLPVCDLHSIPEKGPFPEKLNQTRHLNVSAAHTGISQLFTTPESTLLHSKLTTTSLPSKGTQLLGNTFEISSFTSAPPPSRKERMVSPPTSSLQTSFSDKLAHIEEIKPPLLSSPKLESSGKQDGSNKSSTYLSTIPLHLKLDRDYTPQEIAEYIYSTGDEHGIAQVVWDMLEEGQIMASTDDVILFLEQVQLELGKMRESLKDTKSSS